MADLDDLREGADFGLGINCENQSFHVKGAENLPWGMKDRLSRIFNPKTGKAVMLAFDHGFIMGPTSGLERIDLNIVPLIEYADCLMCTRGILQSTIPANTTKPICLRSDAGTSILTDLNDNVLIDIEDAIRMNVSAMAVMLGTGRCFGGFRSCPTASTAFLSPGTPRSAGTAGSTRMSPLARWTVRPRRSETAV